MYELPVKCKDVGRTADDAFPLSAMDLKTGRGALLRDADGGRADVTFTVADEDFMDVVMGKLNPQKVPALLWRQPPG